MAKIKEKINGIGKRDWMRGISGVLTILLVALVNGFAAFIPIGFKFSKILTSAYWANFSFLLFSEIAVMLGTYLIQKGKDLKNKKIVDIQTEIDEQRAIVYKVDKVDEAEAWLREIYNYQEKLNIFEYKVTTNYNKIKPREPIKGERFYERKNKKYNKKLEQQKFLIQQMNYIKKDRQRLSLIVNNKEPEKVEELTEALNSNAYVFKTTKLRYKTVYWCNLLSDMEETKNKPTSAYFNEKAELSKDSLRYIALGLISSAFTSSLIFQTLTNVGWNTVLNLLITLFLLLVFMGRGIGLCHKNILGRYYKALESRKSIYTKMLKDLQITNVVFEDEDETKDRT